MKIYKKEINFNPSEYLTIYSVRNQNEIKELFKNKVLQANNQIIENFWKEDENFILSYKWMNQKCQLMLTNYDAKYPLWGWIKKPNKKNLYKEYKNDPFYIIEFIIKKDEVLISDFDLWHFILMDLYIPDNLENLDKLDHVSFFEKRGSVQEIEEVLSSWNKIFNIKRTKKYKQQCCFKEIKFENILKIKKYQKGLL